MRSSFDPIDVVEQAYRIGTPRVEWHAAIARAAAADLDQGSGVGFGSWRLAGGRIRDLQKLVGSIAPEQQGLIDTIVDGLTSAEIDANYSDLRVATMLESGLSPPPTHLLADLVGASCPGHPGLNGVVLVAPSQTRVRLSVPRRRRWERIMRHVAAAFRLKERLATAEPPAAVLDPDGRVHHANAEALQTRDDLVDAVRTIERVRGRLRRTDPDEALASWRALVAGRWSVVDWVDTDQRRYLVVHANPVSARSARALSSRERDVAEFLVAGRTQGEIAYALGVTEGNVNRLARSVLRKFGGARRTDLAALFGALPPLMANVVDELKALSASSNSETWSQLTPSQRQVAELVLHGLSDAEVARRRGVSAKTVSNQLGMVYERLGVSGRTELASLLGRRAP